MQSNWTDVDNVAALFDQEIAALEKQIADQKAKRSAYINNHLAAFSPFWIGQQIRYRPSTDIPMGIVKIESIFCDSYPDLFRLRVRVLAIPGIDNPPTPFLNILLDRDGVNWLLMDHKDYIFQDDDSRANTE